MNDGAQKRRLQTTLIALVSVMSVALGAGCEADKVDAPAEAQVSEAQTKRAAHFRARARRLSTQLGKGVVFQAQEINMLDPRSERAASSRRARQLLEQITDDPAPDAQGLSPENPPQLPRPSP